MSRIIWRRTPPTSPDPGSEARGRGRDVVARAPVPLGGVRAWHQVRDTGRVSDPPPDAGLHALRQPGYGCLDRRPLRDHRVDPGNGVRVLAQPLAGPACRHRWRGVTRLDVER